MAPFVSVIMANFRGAAYLAEAARSVLGQTHQNLELIFADDASPDQSVKIMSDLAKTDHRIKILLSETNAGPGPSRNRGLDAATGDWVAIMDSDDLMHPARIERMLAAAEALDADIIADDLVFFGQTPDSGGKTLLQPLALQAPMVLDSTLFLRASGEDPRLPAMGYLKPLIRRTSIGKTRYSPTLRIGEDYDFYLRLLIQGARFMVLPDPMYLYRRHGGSVSHRLSVATVQAMRMAHAALAPPPSAPPEIRQAHDARSQGLDRQFDFERLVERIKLRQGLQATRIILRRPDLLLRLFRSAHERFNRKGRQSAPRTALTLSVASDNNAQGDAQTFRVPAIPKPAKRWPCPPAHAAARLSGLVGRHDLTLVALDEPGQWFAALSPSRTALSPARSGDGNP